MNLQGIKKIVSPIAQRYGVAKVLLFGSRARGEERPDSDYDFLITKGGLKSLWQFSGFWQDLQDALQAQVDVVSDTSFDAPLIAAARKDGVLVYEQP
ncbi:MAG: nucleotidyltransferase domain-containing protein [Planctomycetes bacterium]|nr:nucleotidyltransferase domain-containing protein [Planctomycetota bacterium]